VFAVLLEWALYPEIFLLKLKQCLSWKNSSLPITNIKPLPILLQIFL
jgi:hypothetical protein